MLGLETALAVTFEALCGHEGEAGAMTRADVLGLLSWRPARIAGLAIDQGGDQGAPIAQGSPANLCVFDPEDRWEVDPARLASRSRNTPWAGRTLTGRVRHTISSGEAVVVDAVAQR
jgi:dihydroorotase